MIRSIQQGLLADEITMPLTKLCAWFGVPRRTVYCKPTKAAPKVDPRFFAWKHWLMLRVNGVLVEIEAGSAGAGSRMRRLHWIGTGANALLTATVVMLIPHLVVAM